MKTESTSIPLSVYAPKEAPDEAMQLMEAAKSAFQGAWAPYSRFRVGAAVLLDDGQVVVGSNQENASFPEGCCAERVALFAAGAQYPDRRPVAIAVTGETVDQAWLAPCGGCRQVMAESERRGGKPMQVILTNAAGEVGILSSASLLLPWLFDGHLLEKPGK